MGKTLYKGSVSKGKLLITYQVKPFSKNFKPSPNLLKGK